MKIYNPTQKQIAAWKRNWNLLRLKSSLAVVKSFLPRWYNLQEIETRCKETIDKRWEIEKAKIKQNPDWK